MELPKPFFLITLLVYLAEGYVRLVSSALPRAMLIGLKEARFRLVNSKSLLAKFLRK
jgi:hypothetical protein